MIDSSMAPSGPSLLRGVHALRASLFILTALVTALFIAWHALAKLDFLYTTWYPLIGIDATIAEYGPKNIHRHDFHTTTGDEHARLFGQINHAIHAQGRGLEDITYLDAQGKALDRLLTPAEIIHLQDVARLVDGFRLAGWISLLAWAALLSWISLRCEQLPSARQALRGSLYATGIGGVVILAIGPKKTFYALHEWVFPAGHQWFFYYEESLMTMLMKAPDLFACIGIVWLALSIVMLALLLKLSVWLRGSRCSGGHCEP